MLNEESSSQKVGWAVRTEKDRTDSSTRAALLKAARSVFERLGYAHTTVAHITAAARVSRATFYVYFSSKSEVFAIIALDVRNRFLEAQEIPGTDLADPFVVARASIEAFLDSYALNLVFITVLEQQAIVSRSMAEVLEQIVGLPVKRTASYIARLQQQGVAKPVADPHDVANAALGMVAWYAKAYKQHPGRRKHCVDAVSAMFIQLLGLQPPAEAPASMRVKGRSQP